jgi:hypothetical protein
MAGRVRSNSASSRVLRPSQSSNDRTRVAAVCDLEKPRLGARSGKGRHAAGKPHHPGLGWLGHEPS